MIGDAVGDVRRSCAGTSRRCRPTEAVERAIEFVDRQTGPDGLMRIALQVWAEAMRDPALAEFVADAYSRMRGHFVLLATRARDAGKLPADADVEAVGAVLFGMVPATRCSASSRPAPAPGSTSTAYARSIP